MIHHAMMHHYSRYIHHYLFSCLKINTSSSQQNTRSMTWIPQREALSTAGWPADRSNSGSTMIEPEALRHSKFSKWIRLKIRESKEKWT